MISDNTMKFINVCQNQIVNQEKNKPPNHEETCKNLKILQQIALFKDSGRNYAKIFK